LRQKAHFRRDRSIADPGLYELTAVTILSRSGRSLSRRRHGGRTTLVALAIGENWPASSQDGALERAISDEERDDDD
jgi:hypothetical protein